MQFSEEVKATLWNFIDEMSADPAPFTVNPILSSIKKQFLYFLYSPFLRKENRQYGECIIYPCHAGVGCIFKILLILIS